MPMSGARCVAAIVFALFVGLSSVHAADEAARCDACIEQRVERLVRKRASLTCDAAADVGTVDRLRKKLRPCLRRRACKVAARRFVSRTQVRASIQRLRCEDGPVQTTSSVDPAFIDAPVGKAPSAVASGSGATFDQVNDYCAAQGDDFEYPRPNSDTPPLMALPDAAELPAWCDEEGAYLDLADQCGPLQVVVVQAGSSAATPDGSAAAPFASIGAALAACAGPCHVLVAPGTYAEDVSVPACSVIEGGIDVVAGSVTSGAARPQIVGAFEVGGDAILARVDAYKDPRPVLITAGDLLVSDSVLRGGVDGVTSIQDAPGPRICRSHVSGGYGGAGIAWEAERLWVAGSAVAGCYEGLAISWASSDLRALGSTVFGGYDAIATSWGSFGATIIGNRLAGGYQVVAVHLGTADGYPQPASYDVEVRDNVIRSFGCVQGGALYQDCLPTSDAGLGIVVEDNVYE